MTKRFPVAKSPYPEKFAEVLKNHDIPYSLIPPKIIRVEIHEHVLRSEEFPNSTALTQALLHFADITETKWIGEGDHFDFYIPKS